VPKGHNNVFIQLIDLFVRFVAECCYLTLKTIDRVIFIDDRFVLMEQLVKGILRSWCSIYTNFYIFIINISVLCAVAWAFFIYCCLIQDLMNQC
jgi:hypothetical protein